MTGDRCGYTLDGFDVPLAVGGVDAEAYFEAAPTCCWRPVWGGRDRCVWHAEEEDKPVDALITARADGPERLDGTLLKGVELGNRISFAGCSLRGAILRRADLSGADLSRADLAGADLNRSHLAGANLFDARLVGAFATATDFEGATLARAVLRDAALSYSTMARADLRSVRAECAELIQVDLSGADLSYAVLREATLTDADLRDADLSVSFLTDAALVGVDLSGANLSRAELDGASLAGAVLSGVILSDAWMTGTGFVGASFSAARPSLAKNPTEADFESADFSGNRFRNEEMAGLELPRADFTDSDLYGTEFEQANLAGAVFDGANCRYVDFRGADLEGASFIETDLRSARLDGAAIYRTTFADSEINVDTSIEAVDRYRSDVETAAGPDTGTAGEDSDGSGIVREPSSSATARNAPRDSAADSFSDDRAIRIQRLERAAWVHRTVHRQLIRSGRVREAVEAKHYLAEQRAEVERAWLRRDPVAYLNLQLSRGLILVSESPPHLLLTVGGTAVAFALLYPLVGGLHDPGSAILYTVDGLTPLAAVRLFLFSLVTLLEGAYTVVRAPLGPFLPLETLEPLGALARATLGVSTLTPEGAAGRLATVERALGALLIVPFSLLVVQRLRLYVGGSTSEEGLGKGLISWLFGR